MLFAPCAQVTQQDLTQAGDAARAASQDAQAVAAYLQASAPWQRHLRQEEAARWSWTQMTPQPLPDSIDVHSLQCPVSCEPLAALQQPVMWQSGQACIVYEAADLLTYWVESGQEPTTRQALDLAQLQRVLRHT